MIVRTFWVAKYVCNFFAHPSEIYVVLLYIQASEINPNALKDITTLATVSATLLTCATPDPSLAALWLVLKELISRLRAYWGRPGWRGKVDELILGAASPLPTNDLYAEIDAHFLRRKKHKELEVRACCVHSYGDSVW